MTKSKTPHQNKKHDKVATTSAPGIKSRKLALEALLRIDTKNAYANIALASAFERTDLTDRDRAFVTALVQGVTRQRNVLDQKIAKLSSRPLEKMPATLKNILRLGVFQLDEMKDIPESAVLNTSNDLAKISGHTGLAKFTNGVLRSYLRMSETERDVESTPQDSIPSWLFDRWVKNFGEPATLKLVDYFSKPPELTLRTCEMAITPEGLETLLKSKDITAHRSSLVNSCLILESRSQEPRGQTTKKIFRGSPEKLPGYSEGLFSIQDDAATLVSIVVDPKPGEFVIDLCAAPGGKTIHLAEIMNNSGQIIAVDTNVERLEMVKDSRRRLGLKNIQTVAADARTYNCDRLADRVLLDAPCSGTGVLNRRSDLRHQKSPDDIFTLAGLQRELLDNASRLVKSGGILVYSTCSLEPEENFDNIHWFLKTHDDFEPDDMSQFLPPSFIDNSIDTSGPACKTPSELTSLFQLQLLPSVHNVSGFFICRLRRKENH